MKGKVQPPFAGLDRFLKGEPGPLRLLAPIRYAPRIAADSRLQPLPTEAEIDGVQQDGLRGLFDRDRDRHLACERCAGEIRFKP